MAFLSLSQTQPPSSSPNHHQAETQISQTQALWFFNFSFSWLIGAETQIKPKPRPIQAETQGWLEWRLIRPIQAEVDTNEEDQ